MRYFIALLLVLLICPASIARCVSVVVGQPTAGAACDDTTGMALATDFEGTGAPSGWSGSSGIDYDYTTTHLRGAESVLVDAGASTRYTEVTFAGLSELWAHAIIQWDTLVAQDYTLVIGGYSLRILDTDGNLRQACGASGASSASPVITADTPYHVWVHLSGLGGTATCETYVGTSTTRPGSTTISNTGTIGESAANLKIQAETSTSNKIVDQVRVDNASFTTVCD